MDHMRISGTEPLSAFKWFKGIAKYICQTQEKMSFLHHLNNSRNHRLQYIPQSLSKALIRNSFLTYIWIF